MPRPDQSFFLAHFTKNGRNYTPNNHKNHLTIEEMSAFDRLISILEERTIKASVLPWSKKPAVCFTECPWGSLLRHANRYSSYGIGFTKKLIYSKNGNPVIYANPHLYKKQEWDDETLAFITPFVPSYAPDTVKNVAPFNGKAIDYTHEREWRITKDLKFQYRNVAFVILRSVKDLESIPNNIINEIGVEKFIFMDTYKKIEELWPTHIME